MTDKTPDSDVGGTTPISVPVAANTGAILAVGLDLQEGKVIPRKQVVSWALWDWATQPFNSVLLTFVFVPLYLVNSTFLPPDVAALKPEEGATTVAPAYTAGIADLSAQFGLAIALAGIAIALLAPVLGQRADASGRRKFWLGVWTALLVLTMFSLFFVQGQPSFFVVGITLMAAGSIFSEIAGVNYNAMLVQVSTPKTVGKVSGLGWGLGYIGGILALIIIAVLFQFDFLGLPPDNGLIFRVIAVGCAVWTAIFVIPIFRNVPEVPPTVKRERVSFFKSYVVLVKDIARLFRESRHTFWFLVASAVYRDGLAGVFTFGAILATGTFFFGDTQLQIFGIVANLVAGVSTIVSGRFDDRFGPRAVVVFALVGLVVAGLAVFIFSGFGQITFWVFGLVLTIFVGPAQAASRSLLARVTPAGRESEIFGLWATTGRAASFISPALFGLFVTIAGVQVWGILGIVLVLAVGLVLMLLVKLPNLKPADKDALPGALA